MPKTKRDRGYGQRKRMSLASRHDRHERRVHACPRCSPNAPDAFRKERDDGAENEANHSANV